MEHHSECLAELIIDWLMVTRADKWALPDGERVITKISP